MNRFLCCLAAVHVALGSSGRAEPVLARPADALVDSIGVNSHFSYTDRLGTVSSNDSTGVIDVGEEVIDLEVLQRSRRLSAVG